MSDYVSRMKDEHREVKCRFNRLSEFVHSDKFDELRKRDQILLIGQMSHMDGYIKSLNERLLVAHGYS